MTDDTHPDSVRIITSSDILLHDAETALMYEELRAAIDDGHESMTHADALAEIAAIRAENVELRAQLEAIGAGGVSGPLMGQPQAMPDLSALTERGAKAWAGVDAQGLRDGVASAGGEPVAWQYRSVRDKGLWFDCTEERAKQRAEHPETWDVRYLYTHPSPPEGMVGGWISVDKRLPEPNVGVLCAGQGWGNPFVTACYYDDERREWYPINTYWTDSTGSAQYPTHWMPLPPPPTSSADSRKGE